MIGKINRINEMLEVVDDIASKLSYPDNIPEEEWASILRNANVTLEWSDAEIELMAKLVKAQ